MTDHRTPLLDGWGKRRRRRRGPSPASVAAIVAAGLAVALAVSIWSVGADRGRRPPSGLEGSARCTLGDGLSGWCGRVTVPTSGSDRRIALRVAILPSTRRTPLGALFYLEGGPGHAATAA